MRVLCEPEGDHRPEWWLENTDSQKEKDQDISLAEDPDYCMKAQYGYLVDQLGRHHRSRTSRRLELSRINAKKDERTKRMSELSPNRRNTCIYIYIF